MPRKPELPSLAREPWLAAPPVQQLMAAIAAGGGEARVAGGAVRNALLGVPVSDIDIATTLNPQLVTQICTAQGMTVHPTGIDHGTVTVVHKGMAFEVTTLRHDVETDGRHAVVAFTDDWRADALRRDFTMNALYADASGKLYDYTNGYGDVLKRKVRFVGSAVARIREDYLRLLRFFRFHAQHGKGSPDKEGLAACIRLKSGLTRLSVERIRNELFKLLAAPGAVPVLKVMARNGILGKILPHTDEWRVIGRLPPDPVLRLCVLAKVPATLQERLRLSNADAGRIAALASAPTLSPRLTAPEQRRMLYTLGKATWIDAVRLSLAQSRARMDDPSWQVLADLPSSWAVPSFPVKGRDLLDLGIPPGPGIGQALLKLEDWWVASDFKPGKDDLLQKAKSSGHQP